MTDDKSSESCAKYEVMIDGVVFSEFDSLDEAKRKMEGYANTLAEDIKNTHNSFVETNNENLSAKVIGIPKYYPIAYYDTFNSLEISVKF